jgi:TP901 family phage tail tape measure protein
MDGGKITYVVDAETGQFIRAMQDVESQAKRTASEITTANDRQVKTLAQSLSQAGGSIRSFGTDFSLGVSIPVIAGFAASIKSAGNFQSSISQLQYASGATAAEMANLTKRARELGEDTSLVGVTAADAATAMTNLSRAGLSVNDTLGATKAVLALAKAGNIEFGQAATVVAAGLSAFNLEGKDAIKVADALANGANKSQANLADLAAGLQQSSSVANLFGISLEDNVTALAIFANNGIRATDAGTSLKTMLLSLATPSKPAREAMEKIGFSAYNAAGEFVGLREVSNRLKTSLAGLTDEQRQNTLGTIFGSDATRAASLLASNAGASYDEMAAAVGESGAAYATANAQLGPYERSLEAFKNSVSELGLQIGELLLPRLTGLANSARDLINWFQGLPAPMKDVIINVGIFAALLGPLSIGIGQFLIISSGFVRIYDNIRTSIDLARLSLEGFKLGLGGAQVASGGAAGAFSVLGQGVGTLMGFLGKVPPLGWIGILAAGIALIGTLLYSTNDEFKKTIDGFIAAIPGFINNIVTFLTTSVPQIFSQIVTFFTTQGPVILQALQNVFLSAFQSIIAIAPSLLSNIIKFITMMTDTISSNITQFAAMGTDIVVKLITGLTTALPTIINTAVQIVTKLIDGIVKALPMIIQVAIKLVTTIIGAIVENLPKFLVAAVAIITALISGIIAILPSLINAAIQIVLAIVVAIIDNLPLIINAAIELVLTLVTALIQNLPMIIEAAITLLLALINGILDNLPMIINAAVSLVTELAGGLIVALPLIIAAAITLIIQLSLALISAIPQLIAAAFQLIVALVGAIIKLVPMLLGAGAVLIVELVKGIISVIGKVIEGAGQIVMAILNAINKLPGQMLDVGKNLVKGLWDGISNMVGWITDKIKGFGKGIMDGIKGFFGIKSPSRVMAEVGKYLVEGLGMGIEDNTKTAVNAALSASSSVLDAFGTAQGSLDATFNTNSSAPLSSEYGASSDSSTSYNEYNITLPNVENADDFAREFKLATEGRTS